jgi:hypothetical protein
MIFAVGRTTGQLAENCILHFGTQWGIATSDQFVDDVTEKYTQFQDDTVEAFLHGTMFSYDLSFHDLCQHFFGFVQRGL